MANERAHSFWLEYGNERLSHVYWQQAYVCYSRWGAAAKVCSMEAAYRKSLDKSLANGKGAGKLTDKRGREIQKVLVEKQIKQLRNYALKMQQSRLRIAASIQAEELAQAMQRLRVEIAERKRTEEQRDKLISDLQKALGEVKTLSKLLPICSHCKNIRDDKGIGVKSNHIFMNILILNSAMASALNAQKLYPDMDLYDDNGEVTED